MMLQLAQGLGENVELGGMVLVALALVKVIEKAWDAQAAKRAVANGDDPLAVISGVLKNQTEDTRAWLAILTGHGESIAKLGATSDRLTDLAERVDRRMEKVERLLIVLTERMSTSDHGKVT